MAKKRFGQKQQKNLVAVGAGVVGVGSLTLTTYDQWKVPAVDATNFYADLHSNVGKFIDFLKMDNGVLLLIGLIGIGIAAVLFRK